MLATLIVKIVVVLLFVTTGAYVHFRGQVRHRLARQITDHSTLLAPYTALMAACSAVPSGPIKDIALFPELGRLRENWRTMRDEALRLEQAGDIRPAPKHNDVAFNTFFKRGWKRFYLKWYGEPLPSAQELCPKSVELVESIPTVNAALFAMLPAHSKLGEHRDPFAGSLRYHLGLKTPNSDACRIYIDGNRYSWRDGEDIVFDETYIHMAVNDSDEARIILFCDVARPIGNRFVRALNRFVTRHIVKISASQNTEQEHVGMLNGVARYAYAFREFCERIKNRQRVMYYTVKYVLMAGIVYLIVIVI